jgi:EthD domain
VIKFMLVSRRRPGDTQEKYFYEWGVIHVALMITTPSVMRTFRRYAQHFSVNGVDGERLLYPLSDMAWDNFADHWLDKPEDNLVPFLSDDYMQRMHPHNFGDSNFIIEYARETFRDEEPGFEPGGVKLVHVVRSRPGLPADQFAVAWREQHAAALLAAGATRPGRLVQNLHAEVDREDFAGTLFESAGVGGYAGIEELWFDDLESLLRFTEDEAVRAAVFGDASPVDPGGSFSLATTERVVYDYTRGAKSSPRPAVLDPASLEAVIDAQKYAGWNVPGWERHVEEPE